MITLSASGGSVTFEFSGNSTYLNDGQITVPVNSLALIIDESDMATFRKAASNDIFVSASIAEFGMTKAELESWYKANMVGSTGGGGGVTSGEVQTMIDEAVSGKADSSDVYTTGQTSGATELATAFAAKQDTLVAGENITISGNVISSEGGGCEVEETVIYDTLNGDLFDYEGVNKYEYVIVDYKGDKTVDTKGLYFVIGDTSNDYAQGTISLDYPNHSASTESISLAEYTTIEYISDIEDFKISVAPAYQSTCWIKTIQSTFNTELKVEYYKINSGSPCTVISTDVVGLVEKVKGTVDKSLKVVSFQGYDNKLEIVSAPNKGFSTSNVIRLEELDASNSVLKPNINIPLGTSGWTSVDIGATAGGCENCSFQSLGTLVHRLTYTYDEQTVDYSNLGSYFQIGLKAYYSEWYSDTQYINFVESGSTYVPSVASSIFDGLEATLDWDATTKKLIVSYPARYTHPNDIYGIGTYDVVVKCIGSNGCHMGTEDLLSGIEYYAEETQPLKPYVQQLRTDVNTISGQVATKQDTLIAGSNITISGNVISATGGGGGSSYTAGDGIDITNDVISVTGKVDTSTYSAYTAATDTALASKQTTLTAGTGISIVDNVISATGGGGSSYSAGTGIDITNDVISVTGMVATSAIVTAVTSASTDVQVPSAKAVNDKLGGLKLQQISQSDYENLPTKDSSTLYIII